MWTRERNFFSDALIHWSGMEVAGILSTPGILEIFGGAGVQWEEVKHHHHHISS